MARCDTNSLLASGVQFASLPRGILKIIWATQLAQWAQLGNPALDITPSALLTSGKCFACLSQRQLKVVTAQLLCELQ